MILAVSVIYGAASLLLHADGMKKYLRYILSLCIISSFIVPVFMLTLSVPEKISDYSDKLTEYSEEYDTELLLRQQALMAKENMENELKRLIISKFGQDVKDIYVKVYLDTSDFGNIKIIKAELYLKEKSYNERVKSFAQKEFGDETEIVIINEKS